MTRVRGGRFGLLAAIDAGRVDPLDADAPIEVPHKVKDHPSDDRRRSRIDRARAKAAKRREALADRPPF